MLRWQMLHAAVDFEVDEGADELRSEALALLSPGARHDNIVRLEGIVLTDAHKVKLLVFELADEGSLDKHIHRLITPPDGR